MSVENQIADSDKSSGNNKDASVVEDYFKMASSDSFARELQNAPNHIVSWVAYVLSHNVTLTSIRIDEDSDERIQKICYDQGTFLTAKRTMAAGELVLVEKARFHCHTTKGVPLRYGIDNKAWNIVYQMLKSKFDLDGVIKLNGYVYTQLPPQEVFNDPVVRKYSKVIQQKLGPKMDRETILKYYQFVNAYLLTSKNFAGLCLEMMCFLNHSCEANCVLKCVSETRGLFAVYTRVDVAEGAPLTLDYCGFSRVKSESPAMIENPCPFQQRQDACYAQFGFICRCSLCIRDAKATMADATAAKE